MKNPKLRQSVENFENNLNICVDDYIKDYGTKEKFKTFAYALAKNCVLQNQLLLNCIDQINLQDNADFQEKVDLLTSVMELIAAINKSTLESIGDSMQRYLDHIEALIRQDSKKQKDLRNNVLNSVYIQCFQSLLATVTSPLEKICYIKCFLKMQMSEKEQSLKDISQTFINSGYKFNNGYSILAALMGLSLEYNSYEVVENLVKALLRHIEYIVNNDTNEGKVKDVIRVTLDGLLQALIVSNENNQTNLKEKMKITEGIIKCLKEQINILIDKYPEFFDQIINEKHYRDLDSLNSLVKKISYVSKSKFISSFKNGFVFNTRF